MPTSGSTDIRWLRSLGYHVVFRHDGWVECLVSHDAERWLGRGADEDEAVADALRAMLPSRAARELLVLRPALEEEQIGAEPVSVTVAAESTLAFAPPAVAKIEPAPPPAPEEQPEIIEPEPRPAPSPAPSPAPAAAKTSAVRLVVAPPMPPDKAIAEVGLLDELIESNRLELSLMTPERQRLAILAWICHARALQAGSGRHPMVVDAVSNIARHLTALMKLWWPGSVTALQIDASPRDVGRELDLPAAKRPRTWHDAAEASERKLRWVEERDEEHHRDEYGWADGAWLDPAPVNADAHLDELVHLVEPVGGSLREMPPKKLEPALRKPKKDDRARYLRWARRTRWLRGFVHDFETWGQLMGRMRWLAAQLEGRDDGLDQVLSADYHPQRSWAAELGQDPDAKRKRRLRKSVLQTRPFAGHEPGRESLIAWLVDAFAVLEAERIAQLVAPFRDVIVALGPDDIPDANRHKRRRLRQVQKHLESVDPGDVADIQPDESDAALDPEMVEHEAPVVDPHQELLDAIRPHTEGKRALFVSNRNDPTLEETVRTAFHFGSLDWCEGSPRRLQTVSERVSGGAYDLVLGATGFQSHSMDTHLIKACKRAKVRYVRVHRGRLLACTLAIARELGIGR